VRWFGPQFGNSQKKVPTHLTKTPVGWARVERIKRGPALRRRCPGAWWGPRPGPARRRGRDVEEVEEGPLQPRRSPGRRAQPSTAAIVVGATRQNPIKKKPTQAFSIYHLDDLCYEHLAHRPRPFRPLGYAAEQAEAFVRFAIWADEALAQYLQPGAVPAAFAVFEPGAGLTMHCVPFHCAQRLPDKR
jgi:hypothetical protein